MAGRPEQLAWARLTMREGQIRPIHARRLPQPGSQRSRRSPPSRLPHASEAPMTRASIPRESHTWRCRDRHASARRVERDRVADVQTARTMQDRDRIAPGAVPGPWTGTRLSRFIPRLELTSRPPRLDRVHGLQRGKQHAVASRARCADPRLPASSHAMAGDPPLKQVVAEDGRGGHARHEGSVTWTPRFPVRTNHDDHPVRPPKPRRDSDTSATSARATCRDRAGLSGPQGTSPSAASTPTSSHVPHTEVLTARATAAGRPPGFDAIFTVHPATDAPSRSNIAKLFGELASGLGHVERRPAGMSRARRAATRTAANSPTASTISVGAPRPDKSSSTGRATSPPRGMTPLRQVDKRVRHAILTGAQSSRPRDSTIAAGSSRGLRRARHRRRAPRLKLHIPRDRTTGGCSAWACAITFDGSASRARRSPGSLFAVSANLVHQIAASLELVRAWKSRNNLAVIVVAP